LKPVLKTRKGTKRDGVPCRSRTAQSAGLRVNELNAEIATEIAIVRAN